MAEISLSLASFRLFFAAGLIKMRAGSPCWKDLTCLYDHYETQPMPNSAAWYFHNYTPRPFLRIMQWFAIDVSECIVPFLLLGFAVSMGPLGVLRRELLRRDEWYLQWLACFPARLVGSVTIMTFVLGMFVGGNYAFLHPLSLVALVASMGIVEGVPMQKKSVSPEKAVYRLVMPWLTLLLLLFAFLPSLRAFVTGPETEDVWYGCSRHSAPMHPRECLCMFLLSRPGCRWGTRGSASWNLSPSQASSEQPDR